MAGCKRSHIVIKQRRRHIAIKKRRSHIHLGNASLLTTAPQPPQNLTVTATRSTEVDLDWDAPQSTPDGYKVYVRKVSTDEIVQEITNISISETTVTGLSGITEYEFWVVSRNGSLESLPSNHVTTTTSASAKLYRIEITGGTPSGDWLLRELTLYENVGGSNNVSAQDGDSVSAYPTSFNSGGGGLIDGDMSTFALVSGIGSPQYIQINLVNFHIIEEYGFKLNNFGADSIYLPNEWNFQASTDGQTWRTLHSGSKTENEWSNIEGEEVRFQI